MVHLFEDAECVVHFPRIDMATKSPCEREILGWFGQILRQQFRESWLSFEEFKIGGSWFLRKVVSWCGRLVEAVVVS